MFKTIKYDIAAIMDRDPAARSFWEVFFLYPCVHALISHRLAHWLYQHKRFFLARWVSQRSRKKTGIEIHPAAKIGKGLFIDHGMGVVIGETVEIGDNCTLYQGVTLGGTGKEKGKRHPTLGNNVLVGSGAKVLGPFHVGDNVKVAANAVVLNEIPPNSTCVGVPARIVKRGDVRVSPACNDLDQVHIPDPISMELCKMLVRLDHLEKAVKEKKETPEDLQ